MGRAADAEVYLVTIAGKQMGVGGDNSWGARVHEPYCIPSDKLLLTVLPFGQYNGNNQTSPVVFWGWFFIRFCEEDYAISRMTSTPFTVLAVVPV